MLHYRISFQNIVGVSGLKQTLDVDCNGAVVVSGRWAMILISAFWPQITISFPSSHYTDANMLVNDKS